MAFKHSMLMAAAALFMSVQAAPVAPVSNLSPPWSYIVEKCVSHNEAPNGKVDEINLMRCLNPYVPADQPLWPFAAETAACLTHCENGEGILNNGCFSTCLTDPRVTDLVRRGSATPQRDGYLKCVDAYVGRKLDKDQLRSCLVNNVGDPKLNIEPFELCAPMWESVDIQCMYDHAPVDV